MIMERIFQTELHIQNNCEKKSVYRFPGEACAVPESKPLQKNRILSGSLHEDIVLKEEAVDEPAEEYENTDVKSSDTLKDVTISGIFQGKKRKKKEKTYPCEKCQVISQSSANLKKHMMTHSGEKPYKCIICQKAFRQRHHLTDHRRTHTGERPFECDECGSRFVQKSSLNLHKKKHSGIKPYSCDMCNHSTYEKMHMIMHMRTHTGEKPYQCEKCGHMFSNATRLKFHRMIHTGERRFRCDECGVNFREKVTLQKHKGVHINIGPFECEECGQEFSRLAGLSLHRKVHTKKQDYLYVFNKTAHDALKSTPAEGATTTEKDIQSSEIESGTTNNSLNAVCSTQQNANVAQFMDSPAVSYEGEVHKRSITSNLPGTEKSDSNVYTSTLDSNKSSRNNVVASPKEKYSQNRMKENLASSLTENIQNHGSVVHPDHVRAALVSGTVLETQDEQGKGFFIVLPPSLKNKDITFISDSTHACGSSLTVPLQVTNHTIDLPENKTVIGNSLEAFSEKDNNDHKEAYQSVVPEIHEVNICNYPIEVPGVEVKCSSREVQELHDDDDLSHYQDESQISQEVVQGELADDEQRYSQVVREEIHADGTSLLLWNDGLEHLTEVTYVIEEGSDDPIMIHPQETKSHSAEMLGDVEVIKSKKRKSKGSEFPDYHVNSGKQKRQKSDCERPVSVRIKVKDKKVKEKRVKTQKVYDCQQCGKVCKTSSNYISHMRTHSGERPYFCDFCGMGFKQIAHLRSHIRIHTGERPYVCTICNAAFTQSSRLNSHRKTKHSKDCNVVIKKDKPVVEHKVRNFYCKVCKKTFINECFKIDHMRTHISQEPYECKICGIRYKSKSSMIKHNLKHSDHKSICEICGAGFLDLSSLQNHRITQHEMSLTESGMSDMCINVKIGEEKDFVVINPSIKDIQKVVVDSDKMNSEFIDVTEANDYQVKQEVIHVTDTDGYVKSEVMPATDFDDLHVKNEKLEAAEIEGFSVEMGESPCSDTMSVIKIKNEIEQPAASNDTSNRDSDICLSSGSELQSLDMAERIKDEFSEKNYATYVNNIGRKIWVCKVCDKPFLQSSNLHSHMRMHTGERPFKCNVCPQAFRQITHLKDHMSRHTGMKPYKCGECGSFFSQRSAVTRHIKNLHNEKAKVIKNTEYATNGGRNMPLCHIENQAGGLKKQQVEKVSRRPRNGKLKHKEDVIQNSAKKKICDVCEKPSTANCLKSHNWCHLEEKPYKCSFCEEVFNQKAHLDSHELHHPKKKPYVCKKCGASFIQSSMLNTHMRKCMGDKEGINTCYVKKHLCECGTSFRLISQLVRHKKSCMVTEDSNDKSTDMTELDARLDKECVDESQFWRKKKGLASKKVESKRIETSETTEFSSSCIDKIFTCKVCSLTLENFSLYKTHLQQHGGVIQQVCEDCGALFRRASTLRFHQRVKHDRIDDRYKDYKFLGQDIKEETVDDSGVDDDHQVQPNYANVKGNTCIENTAKKIEENSMKSNRRQVKDDVKENYTHKSTKQNSDIKHTKIKGKRSITLRRECVGRISDKSMRGSTRLKNKKNKRSLIVPDCMKLGKESSIVVDKLVNESQKVPVGGYETLYACEACGKDFTRSSKLKHHVAMWCKGLQDQSEVDASKNIKLKQKSSKRVKRVK